MSKQFKRFDKWRKLSTPNFLPVFTIEQVAEPANVEKLQSAVIKKEKKTKLGMLLTCPICFIAISSNKASNLNRHMLLHQNEIEVFKCNVCNRKYQNQGNFNTRKQSKHPDIDPEKITFEKVKIDAKSMYHV